MKEFVESVTRLVESLTGYLKVCIASPIKGSKAVATAVYFLFAIFMIWVCATYNWGQFNPLAMLCIFLVIAALLVLAVPLIMMSIFVKIDKRYIE